MVSPAVDSAEENDLASVLLLIKSMNEGQIYCAGWHHRKESNVLFDFGVAEAG